MQIRKLWTVERIRDGFEQFRAKEGRLPTAPEIDILPYLPSSRFIQKKFGGLEELRRVMGYEETHFGKSTFRSRIATRVNVRGRSIERSLQSKLEEKFGEPFVHVERGFGILKNRLDFYIFCPDGNFGIDIFQTDSWRNLQSNVNIKIKKYDAFKEPLYLVTGNSDCTQEQVDEYVQSKANPLPTNIKLITLNTLYQILENKSVYPNPVT